jgi:hypothetical protein
MRDCRVYISHWFLFSVHKSFVHLNFWRYTLHVLLLDEKQKSAEFKSNEFVNSIGVKMNIIANIKYSIFFFQIS